MFIWGHLAGGYVATRALLRASRVGRREQRRLLLVGTLAAAAPDIDVLLHAAYKRSLHVDDDFDHHKWISHAPLLYVAIGAAAYAIARQQGRAEWMRTIATATAGVLLHLAQDSIGSGTGIRWLWPFSARMMGVCTLHVTGSKWARVYRRHPIAWVERGIVLVAVGLLAGNGWESFHR